MKSSSKKKKSVAILVPTFSAFSGPDQVAKQQAEDYVKKGWDVRVVTLEGSFRPKNVEVIELGLPESPLRQRLFRLFLPLFPKTWDWYNVLEGADVVISHLYPMNYLAKKAKEEFGCEYIYHDHGINASGPFEHLIQRVYMQLFLWLSNWTLQNVDSAQSVSKFLQQQLKKQSGINSKVVYNKIDTALFSPKVREGKLRTQLLLEDQHVLLYVGRIAPHKKVQELIKILHLVQKQQPNTKLVVVGKATFGHYFKKLKRRGKEHVIFTGVVEDKDLPKYYALCDVYVTASHWEGFNLPAAEAQACGKPVVAYDIGSHPEIVKNGTLVKKRDYHAFADAIVKYLT